MKDFSLIKADASAACKHSGSIERRAAKNTAFGVLMIFKQGLHMFFNPQQQRR
ncbi:MAG: hypothetical protein LBS36_04720 [Oscillospiraceae bacterium]|jgi:hypothetical protein|nr:hypothetical protein [Oscillospiraceae bacterium]